MALPDAAEHLLYCARVLEHAKRRLEDSRKLDPRVLEHELDPRVFEHELDGAARFHNAIAEAFAAHASSSTRVNLAALYRDVRLQQEVALTARCVDAFKPLLEQMRVSDTKKRLRSLNNTPGNESSMQYREAARMYLDAASKSALLFRVLLEEMRRAGVGRTSELRTNANAREAVRQRLRDDFSERGIAYYLDDDADLAIEDLERILDDSERDVARAEPTHEQALAADAYFALVREFVRVGLPVPSNLSNAIVRALNSKDARGRYEEPNGGGPKNAAYAATAAFLVLVDFEPRSWEAIRKRCAARSNTRPA